MIDDYTPFLITLIVLGLIAVFMLCMLVAMVSWIAKALDLELLKRRRAKNDPTNGADWWKRSSQ